jgi:hypothetical protein
MTDERPLQEAIARCVSIMVFYKHSDRTPRSLGLMTAEIRTVARTVEGMANSDVGELAVDRQVESELMARYGHEVGPRLLADFMDAYGTVGSA